MKFPIRNKTGVHNPVVVSAFAEKPPDYPGGIWILDGDKPRPIYQGYGVFGLACLNEENLLIGVTRSDASPLLAFRKAPHRLGFNPIPVEYHGYIPARAAHGIAIFEDRLFVVAAQGDPGAPPSTNDHYGPVRAGRVIISKIQVQDDCVTVAESQVWNPFQCDHHHHYNDILIDRDWIYLSSFSTCNQRGEYVPHGSVSRFNHNLTFDSILADSLDAPHSLEILERQLFVCSSRTSSIHSISLTTPDPPKLEYKGINNFVRGLHATRESIYVGLSKSSGRTNSAHLTDSTCGILNFNRRTGETTRINLPNECDNVYSILSTEPS